MSPRIRIALAILARPATRKCPAHFAAPLGSFHPKLTLSSIRCFATHTERPIPGSSTRPSGSSSSSSAPSTEDLLRRLEADARKGGSGFRGQETVGPFPLGVGPSGRSKGWKRWGELGIGGKVARAGRQTGNLSVILVGGTLFVILAFALSTELFAKNSPSVLYSQAVDLIRASDALNAHLLPPLSFTHTPHAAAPIRGSPPLPHRNVLHPRSGREHMLLTFWVHGRGIGEEEPLGFVKRYYRTVLEYGHKAGEWAGLVPPSSAAAVASASTSTAERVESASKAGVEPARDEGSGWLGGMLGGFSGLRGGAAQKTSGGSTRGAPPPGTYKVGEVHGDYVKNAAGQYQLLSLVIDIPGSHASYPTRAVVFWSPEADTEGLQGRKR